MDQNLNELFALPVKVKLVAVIDNQIKLYSSNSLKEKYVKSMSKEKQTKACVNEIERLVKNDKILPCFLSKGFFSFVGYKIFAPSGIKMISGFYYNRTDKIYLLIDNNISRFGFGSNRFLALLTMHEGMHMFASQNPTGFLSLFKNELTDFYTILFQDIFQIKGPIKDVEKIYEYAFLKIETPKKNITNSVLSKYYDIMESILKSQSGLSEEDFKNYLTDYIVAVKLFTKGPVIFINNIRKFPHIIRPVYDAYRKAFGMKNLTTVCIQELLYPSEVIAILSEKASNPKIKTAFKRLK